MQFDFDAAQLNAAISEGMKGALLVGALIGAASTRTIDLAENLYWQWRSWRRSNRIRRMREARTGARP